MPESVPQTLGVCPICWGEFSVPDAKRGDTCPMGPHDEQGDPPLVIFVREEQIRETIQRVLDLRSSYDADRDVDTLLVNNLQAREMLTRLLAT